LESRRLAWLEAVAMGSAAAAARVFAASGGVIRYPCEAGLMAAAGGPPGLFIEVVWEWRSLEKESGPEERERETGRRKRRGG
jgi:hypothetical protein